MKGLKYRSGGEAIRCVVWSSQMKYRHYLHELFGRIGCFKFSGHHGIFWSSVKPVHYSMNYSGCYSQFHDLKQSWPSFSILSSVAIIPWINPTLPVIIMLWEIWRRRSVIIQRNIHIAMLTYLFTRFCLNMSGTGKVISSLYFHWKYNNALGQKKFSDTK